jgi:PAS domain S-box-containing protein
MIYLDLIINLSLLVALSVVSGFIDSRWSRRNRLGVLMQGALFGGASVIGMLHPLNLGPGLIFDGRSVMVSLCALFFGPWAASLAGLMTITCRIWLGGVGTIMGVLVILSSIGIGLVAHFRLRPSTQPPSTRNLYFFGLVVHVAMIALMLTLPGNIIMSVVKRVGIPVILLYPLATILVGKILSDQMSEMSHVEALRISEEKYKTVFETANVGKSITLVTGEINVNQAFCDMLGYIKDELKNKRWQDITPAEDIEPTQEILDSLLQGQKDFARFNKRYKHKSGSYIWADVSVAINRDVNRNILFFVTTIIDITESKRVEDALRESEQQLSLITDNVRDTIWLMDLGMRTTWISPSVVRTRGYNLAELAEMPMDRHLTPGSLARMMELSVVHLTPERLADPSVEIIVSEELEYYRKNGSTFWADTVVTLLRDKKGRPSVFLGVGKDITDRKLAEGKLQASEARLRTIVDSTPFPMALVDVQDSNIEYWSRSALDLFGHTAPTTTDWYQLAYPDPEYRREVIGRWKPFLETARLSGKPVNTGEYRVSCHDGSARICELYATFLSEKLIVTFNDITERKSFEEFLKIKNLVFDTSISANSIADLEGVIKEANNAFLQNWGYQRKDEVVGKPISYFLNDPDEAVAIINALNGTGKWQGDFTAKKKDGSTFIANSMATVVRDENGKVIGYQSSVVDITDRKHKEEEIRELNENLEHMVKERTAELSETIDLLEETNRAFVGRELRMVELKEQIVELEAKITEIK